VLQPLADLRPAARLPGDARTVSERLRDLPDIPRVSRFAPPGGAAAALCAPRLGEGESS
jgi:hypothetical protein